MLIEDKAVGGRFTRGQAGAYKRWTDESCCHRSVLVAPKSFLDSHAEQRGRFTGAVSLEDLADALGGDPPKGADGEEMLAASYRHRAEELRRCAAGPPPPPLDPKVEAFGSAYKELALCQNGGLVQINPGSMRLAHTRDIDFMAWSNDGPPNFQPYHKLELGLVDFRVPGYTVEQLRWLLDAVPAEAGPPKAWHPSRQITKNSHSVLRFVVDKREGPLEFDNFSEVAATALDALAELRRWWDGDGEALLRGCSDSALRWMVSRAAEVALLRGQEDQAKDLSAVAQSLPDPRRARGGSAMPS